MRRVRAANPGPSALWVVNPNKRRKTKMATRRRRTRRRARRNPVLLNPTRRRRRVARRRRNSWGMFNPTRRRRTTRRRRRNPMMMNAPRRRRRYSRRRNPIFFRRRRRVRNQGRGVLAKGFTLATFAAVQQFLLMWVPPIGGVSALADAGRTAALGWLLGVVMRRTGILSQYADDATLAGFTLAGGKVITAFILPFATRVFQPAAPAEVPANNGAQMSGMATYYRGQQPFRRYAPVGSAAGMRGMATYARGQQPYGAYGTYTGALIA